MGNSYVSKLIKSHTVLELNHVRTIITDRMGPYRKQVVPLTWEGKSDRGIISITPAEMEVLFTNGLVKNVDRDDDGRLYVTTSGSYQRCFDGAIVCGILTPSTQANLRQEILKYAKKMGYVTDTMTPVEMLSGTKSLIFNTDGTYSIFFTWHNSVLKQINPELLDKFTKNFFGNLQVEVKSNGILMENLSENKAFSIENINVFREYDIQLFYLNPEFDKKLLLRAVMQRAFIHMPCNTLRRGQFEKIGNINIPEDRQERLTFSKFGKRKMSCGTVYHNIRHDGSETYTYQITVPYTESIRELMMDTEKVLRAKYGKSVYVGFSGFSQDIHISYNGGAISADVERELVSLDYAMTLLRDEEQFDREQLYSSIISLLESDSSGQFRKEYFSYLSTLKLTLPEKCDLL